MSDSNNAQQTSNIMLVLAGTMVISIHFVLAMTVSFVYGVLAIVYVVGYVMVALSFIKKKKACMTQTEYDTAFYMSAFILSIQVITLILTLYFMVRSESGYNKGYSTITRRY